MHIILTTRVKAGMKDSGETTILCFVESGEETALKAVEEYARMFLLQGNHLTAEAREKFATDRSLTLDDYAVPFMSAATAATTAQKHPLLVVYYEQGVDGSSTEALTPCSPLLPRGIVDEVVAKKQWWVLIERGNAQANPLESLCRLKRYYLMRGDVAVRYVDAQQVSIYIGDALKKETIYKEFLERSADIGAKHIEQLAAGGGGGGTQIFGGGAQLVSPEMPTEDIKEEEARALGLKIGSGGGDNDNDE